MLKQLVILEVVALFIPVQNAWKALMSATCAMIDSFVYLVL